MSVAGSTWFKVIAAVIAGVAATLPITAICAAACTTPPSLDTAFRIALVFDVPLERVFQYEMQGGKRSG